MWSAILPVLSSHMIEHASSGSSLQHAALSRGRLVREEERTPVYGRSWLGAHSMTSRAQRDRPLVTGPEFNR